MSSVNPIILKDTESEKTYTLRFTRNTVRKMEQNGFALSDLEDHPMSRIPELFHGAFLADQPFMKREATDKILFEDLGGLTDAMLERLGQLYGECVQSLVVGSDEPKNRKMTVEM